MAVASDRRSGTTVPSPPLEQPASGRQRALAWALTATASLFIVAALWMIWASLPDAPARTLKSRDEMLARTITLLGWTAAIAVGALIAQRQPHNPYGWVWLGLGLTSSFQAFGLPYVFHALVIAPGSLPGAGPILILMVVGWVVQLSLLSFALLLFPTGRVLSPGWRKIAWIAAGFTALAAAIGWALPGRSAFLPIENPYAAGGLLGNLITVVVFAYFFSLLAFILLSAVSLVVRFRRSGHVERQQLKWFALAGLILTAYLVSDFWIELPGFWEPLKEAAVFAAMPLSVGIAILRHRLYDIDVILRKTLVYGILTGLLTASFLGTVAVLQNLMTTAGGPRSQVATVISTLLIAALFTPLRARVQTTVDRRFFRQRYDAARALAGFSTVLRYETDLEVLSNRLMKLIEETVQPASVSLWVRAENK